MPAGVVVIGKVVVFRTVGGDGIARNGHIHGAGLHGGLAGVEAHGLDHQGLAHLLGNVLGQRHVKAHVLVLAGLGGVHKFHGGEVGGEGHGQGLGGGFFLISEYGKGQHDGHNGNHHNGSNDPNPLFHHS